MQAKTIPSHALYLHIPFCAHRCAYCDFNTYAGQEANIPAYIEALIREIETFSRLEVSPIPAHTIFFGGGTPSLLTTRQLRTVIEALTHAFAIAPNAETSLEANPGTVSAAYLAELRQVGFNRLSFGVQSANPLELRLLERVHDFPQVIQTVKWARQAGFNNLNLDLIYALPEQTLENWQNSVRRIADLGPEHISMYALTLEHGTPFGRWAAKGLLPIPDPDLAAEMYEWAGEYLAGLGYQQYEISNWAILKDEGETMKDEKSPSSFILHPPAPLRGSSFQCQHNLQYWRNLPYLGLGAGAHGYAGSVRYSNVLRIKTYIERLAGADDSYKYPLTASTVNQHHNTAREDMQETMFTSLRLTIEGISDETFRARFGQGIEQAFPQEVERLLKKGMVEWHGSSLRLTSHARLLANQAFMEFV